MAQPTKAHSRLTGVAGGHEAPQQAPMSMVSVSAIRQWRSRPAGALTDA
ncbi:MAG: hypothetical protein IPK29_20405 [Betaproteobacteria bacterium]|nr:hypothetical protein [Betaproteobacteria bacterium]